MNKNDRYEVSMNKVLEAIPTDTDDSILLRNLIVDILADNENTLVKRFNDSI